MNDDRADWREAWALFPGDVCYVWHGGLHAGTVAASLESAGFATHLKLIRGNPGKRRLNGSEPAPQLSLPSPPPELCVDARIEWERVAGELHQIGVLSSIDRGPLAAYCQAYGRWIGAERSIAKMAERDQLTEGLMIKTTNGNAVQNPLVGTANKAMADMVRFAAEFGMTPSARSRVQGELPGDETSSGFNQFVSRW
jgi:P27 family predicted phage terminase small subunit